MQLNGLQLQALGTGIQACMSLLAKLLSSHGHGVFQIVLFRSLLLLHFAMYLAWHDAESPFASSRMRLLVLRGIFGFLAISSMYWSLSVMSMQDAMVFLYLTPCLVAASSPVVLGQPVHKATYISIPVAFVGVMLVAKPPLIFGSQPGVKPMGLTEFLIGCSQALFATLTKLSVTILGSTEPISHIIASVAIVSCIGSITGSIFILQDWLLPHSLVDVGYFLGVGLCACLVQLAGTLALQRGNASSVMAISYSGIVWSILLDYVVFHTVPQMWGILGAALIIASNLGLVMTRQE